MPDRESLVGYSYTLLTEDLDFKNHAHALTILEEAEAEGIFTGSFMDVMYLCNNCSNSYLLIRENCPKCGSSYLDSHELIHHFSCAYIGQEEEFKSGDQTEGLVCPKCSKTLKHIGVDYDKPSSIFECRNCDNQFQDPLLKAKCNHCSADNHVEHLERKVLKKYTLTARGKDLAEGNLYWQSKQERQEPISPRGAEQILFSAGRKERNQSKIQSELPEYAWYDYARKY